LALSANAASELDETIDCAIAEAVNEMPSATSTATSVLRNDCIISPNLFEVGNDGICCHTVGSEKSSDIVNGTTTPVPPGGQSPDKSAARL
jgi:hypothetical protein